MENEVWGKAAQFLKELRCENTSRESYLELPEYKAAVTKKSKCLNEYEDVIKELQEEKQEIIKRYLFSVECCAEEENQQAYLQGMIDMLMILSGIGFLPAEFKVKDIVEQLK